MPLTKILDDQPREEQHIGIGFCMRNGDFETVRVWVDKGALRSMQNKNCGTEMAGFQTQRSLIETIASANYDAGIIEPDGSTIIRREDIAVFS